MTGNRMKALLFTTMFLSLCIADLARADFLVSVRPADLQFDGPGSHTINFQIAHNGAGPSTLSGYTMRIGSTANASQGMLPAGVTALSATEVLPVSTNNLFSLNSATNTIAASSLGGDQNIGNAGTATLFSLNLNLGSAASYSIGVDFQNAQRGGLFATDISSEFFNPNSATTDFSFTLQNTAAIPEPSSIALVLGSFGIALLRSRRRS
jgi:hypothetical protein